VSGVRAAPLDARLAGHGVGVGVKAVCDLTEAQAHSAPVASYLSDCPRLPPCSFPKLRLSTAGFLGGRERGGGRRGMTC
jgi:hypothetical protein